MITSITNPGELAGIFPGDDTKFGTAEYACIDPCAGEDLLDYFNGAIEEGDRVKAFEKHLFLCHKCQETFLRLDVIFDVLKEEVLGGSGGHHNTYQHAETPL